MTTETPLTELNRPADSPFSTPGNAVLDRNAEEAMPYAHVLSRVAGQTEHAYCEMQYAAGVEVGTPC